MREACPWQGDPEGKCKAPIPTGRMALTRGYNLCMFRWVVRARVVLILVLLALAIYTPVVTSGYMDVSRGDDALRHEDYVVRIMQQFSIDDYASAAQSYESASWKLPWRPELLEQAAMAMSHVNNDEAIALFEKARERGALSADGWDMYGFQYWATSRDQEALTIWSAGLKHYPTYRQFYASMHLAYRQLQDFPQEQTSLAQWLDSANGTAMEHYELGELLMASSSDKARAELRRAVSMEAGYADAVETLETSLTLADLEASPSRRLVIIGRGLGLVNGWPLAQYDFQQAVNADPQDAEAWAWLGEAQQQNKQDGKAALDEALELDPKDAIVRALRGLYWKRHGEYAQQLEEYQTAAQIEPDNPQWQAALGEAYTLQGDMVAALAAYQKATALAPNEATYWRLLALFCADNGVQVYDLGLPAARKAAELAPKDPQVLDALGWSYAQAGLLSTAVETLVQAASLSPDSASLHLHLAEAYLRQGDQSSAYQQLKKVVDLDGEGPAGQMASQLLQQYFP